MNIIFSMFLSLFLFVIGIYLYKKTRSSIMNRVFFSVLVFASTVFYLFYGISNYFTGNGITSAVVYHLKYGLEGAGFSEYWEIIVMSVVVIILGLVFSGWVFSKSVKSKTKRTVYVYVAFSLILLSLLSSPAISDLYGVLFQNSDAVGLDEFYKQLQGSNTTDFGKFYKLPYIKQVDDSRNLVIIYAEGLELTYFNETIFPGLIKGLRELQSKSTYFTGIKQVTNSGVTISGMVASQCGIPLFTPSNVNSMGSMDEFLPLAVCLGDLLHKEGHYLVYYGGANVNFAGKGKFLSTHKFDEIYGKDKLLPKLQDKSYKSGWGLYDDSLFDLAYWRFKELSEIHDKFALFLLTLDTHGPEGGYPSKSCQDITYKDGSNPTLNSVVCSDYLITKFVNKIMQSPYGKETVVVVVSDHLALRNTASELLKKGERKNLFIIIEPNVNKSTKIEQLGSTLDIGATILPFIGYKGVIGLGRDLTNKDQSTSEIEYIQNNLRTWKPYISLFWNFPKIQEYVEINITNRALNIDGRTFRIPVLVELNDKLETTLKFHNFREGQRLIDYVLKLDKNTFFLWIDECNRTNKLDKTLGQSGFCLIMGKGDEYYKSTKLIENIVLTTEDIQFFTGLSSPPNFQIYRIAHAGGGIDGKTYKNSIDALNHSIKKGFLYFELDFVFTKDGHLVCLHDWENNFKKSFGFKTNERLDLETFKSLVKKSEYKQCTLDTLISWMKENPKAYIVTDVKEDNLKALQMMSEKVPNFKRRIIPQIYRPSNYNNVKRMGFEQIIWTLYRYNGMNEDVLKWVDEFKGPFAITMPQDQAASNLPTELAKKHISTYVHTINTLEEKNKFINKFNITEIYTDFLYPKDDTKQSKEGTLID